MAELALKNVRKSYGGVEVIKGVDLEVNDGEFVVFVGPSGCGKSTLLRMMAGLEEITSGELWIDDTLCNNIPAKARGIAMVFQSYALYPHKTVFQNMSFGLKIARTPREEIEQKVRAAADILEIGHLLERKPSQLSGGQRQRVAIGRAIVRDPKVFLFDEPLSNLDAALRVHMRMELAKLHADLGATMAYVTHDQVEAMTLADRIVVLDGGVMRQVGTPLELYHTPADMFVAGFIGSPKMNFIGGRVTAAEDFAVAVETDDFGHLVIPVSPSPTTSIGDAVTIGIRPEHVLHESHGQGIACRIEIAEHIGDHAILKLQAPSGQSLIASASGKVFWSPGQICSTTFDPEHMHLFDAKGRAMKHREPPQILRTASM